MPNLYSVSSSPHIRTEDDTRMVMLDVLIALCFPLAVSVYFYGIRSLVLCVFSAVVCLCLEALFAKLRRRPVPIRDFSAAVTGVLFAFLMPPDVPFWIVFIGDAFAIVVIKGLFGGIGKNFLNPALGGYAAVAGYDAVGQFIDPGTHPHWLHAGTLPHVVTPLWISRFDPALLAKPDALTLQNHFLGDLPSAVGEGSKAILLLAGVFLCVRGVITPRIPLAFLGTFSVLAFCFPLDGLTRGGSVVFELLVGSAVLGAVFFAAEPVTSPVTKSGQWLYGAGCGALCIFFRFCTNIPEPTVFAILLMNLLTWEIDKLTRRRRS